MDNREKRLSSQVAPDDLASCPQEDLPRLTKTLYGHSEIEKRFQHLWESDRLPHAILLAGPKGIGKATFAYRWARFLLSQDPQTSPGRSLFLSPQKDSDTVFQWISSGVHPDFLVIEHQEDPKTGKIKRDITAEEIRLCTSFFSLTSHSSPYRIVLIDSIDALTTTASNALLKILEEPPGRALFFLISHVPGRLLPTIASRSVRFNMFPLSESEMETFLTSRKTQWKDLTKEDLSWITETAQGSPGQFLTLLTSPITLLFKDFEHLIENPPLDGMRLESLCDDVLALKNESDFLFFSSFLLKWVAKKAKHALVQNTSCAHEWAEIYGTLETLMEKTISFHLDQKHALLIMLSLCARR